ncbi:general secretion pathway protein GspE [Myxococcus sp. CA051A]|uniref:General secretion pathway protein GspE n=1 Tax=Myxococcus llanfairpwllgwyngyllgogerychwyrndrobwllllantysiliogogogochensis TaxID=2590453 RepID=A0A540WII4_9BACT|nr:MULTISPECIES: general secretion pathway protein GspE [Myxococcus]NTX02535.1 general secretion pathway protein GspE [Myxococcus sp. CA040A]NTX16969.1 general secretion pathway protein GspE [Myxococcus sp. CA056]NTX36641.1 general secretion pathway protein GspE [Myxococcus sp. CA033]NTX58174.1 general secretion pathway protein GspE [Myxococcus sp. CA039A]NTX66273.1 general secretion pathway protein GspE [Myxococcus sp. CA051A]
MDAGLLTETQLRSALAEQRKWGGRLGLTLVQMRFVDESSMVHALSRQLSIPTVELDGLAPSSVALQALRADIAERYTVFPTAADPANKLLTVATSDPTNVESLQELAFHTGQRIQVVVAAASSIERAIRRHYHGEITSATASPLSFNLDEQTFELAPPSEPMEMAGASRSTASQTPAPVRESELTQRVDILTQQVADLERMVAQQARSLRAMLELLETRGLVTRDDYLAKVR